ncbi:hypothetical protein HRR83_007917 [Exophiala dermatitidis]|uniref:Uncharacterized protein n=1 Tax=Exophiala dermatitidis TaxID=5970 RepID=A0AAN6IUC3_EXODE|nr:hypothetical protein HRR74_007428 [Exophiala dermatitidis]KAJ4510089.1 hypothetical protein HRR73_006886 [Exophiala dermatitidis]KAJ4539092.1 hypothetical protein HRR77_006507 [Exophiala dermatitidis]KAJ4540627.1 hypothetical protein HRR76_004015 [Exophiala dermatitidis]KAJ4564539.1 hypothetical protein HRR79_005799 [Exophiala dermatitidis]
MQFVGVDFNAATAAAASVEAVQARCNPPICRRYMDAQRLQRRTMLSPPRTIRASHVDLQAYRHPPFQACPVRVVPCVAPGHPAEASVNQVERSRQPPSDAPYCRPVFIFETGQLIFRPGAQTQP